jgi:hypothetical protein
MSDLHAVTFSGGAASSVVGKLVADEHKDKTVLLFHDTKTEPLDNYRFRAEVAAFIGLPITESTDGRDIWQLFWDKNFLGNQKLTPCSITLKQKRGDAWIREHKPTCVYFGFTPDEYLRAQRTYARVSRLGCDVRFPLIEKNISKEDCFRMVTRCWGLRLPEMYEHFEHANCLPCVKGGLAYWGLIYKYARDAWNKAVAAEKRHGRQILSLSHGYATLEEELPHLLQLADEYEKQKRSANLQMKLFELPCECLG